LNLVAARDQANLPAILRFIATTGTVARAGGVDLTRAVLLGRGNAEHSPEQCGYKYGSEKRTKKS
jgi:hypothetical protein